MKNVIRSSTTALLALGFASLASAQPVVQPVVPGFTTKLTLALTQSETVVDFSNATTKGSVTTEVIKTKIQTTRFGVKELLQGLQDDDTIIGSIEGWSIVGVTESGSDTPLLFAVNGARKILIDAPNVTASAEKGSLKTVTDSVKDTSTETGSYGTKAAVEFTLLDTDLYGIATSSASLKTLTLKDNDYTMEVPGTYSLAGISGGTERDPLSDGVVIEGSAKLSGAKFEDVASFTATLNQVP